MTTVGGTTFPRGFRSDTDFAWPLRPVRDLVELRYGKALVASKRRPGKVTVFGTNGPCGQHDEALFEGPGVVLGRKGMGPLGVEWSDDDYWVIDTAYSAAPRTELLDMRFFYYVAKYVGLNHLKDGTSNPSLSRDTFGAQLYPLPPLPEQRRIAEILGALDDKIELNRKMNQTLEEMAQAIFKSWFIDFDGHTEFVDSELGRIPKGWRVVPIRDLCEAVFDGPHATPKPSEKGAIFLGIKNMTPTGLNLSDFRRISEEEWPRWTKRVVPRAGDIVFTYEATLGFFAMLPENLRCCLGRRMALVRPDETKLGRHFLFRAFVGQAFQAFLKTKINPGSTVDRILLKDFPGYPMIIPPLELSARFDAIAGPLHARIETLQAETMTLTELRNTLLPKLISGELRVPEAQKTVGSVA